MKQTRRLLARVRSRGRILPSLSLRRPAPGRTGPIIALVIIAAAEFALMTRHFIPETSYALGAAAGLLPEVSETMAAKLKYDDTTQEFSLNKGQEKRNDVGLGTLQQAVITAHRDGSKGITVEDPASKTNFTMTPKFGVASGKKDGNRIVYPLNNGQKGWLVYGIHGVGTKEDILLTESPGETASYDYDMKLSDGHEARLLSDGSVGVYGNSLFGGDVTTGSDADADLLKKARESADKDTLLFRIPKPVIVEHDKKTPSATASFKVSGQTLTVTANGLEDASYPLSIDPSIYIASAEQFMYGNNETNVNFNVADKLIEKGRTTGARFDTWEQTLSLPASSWGSGSAAAGGYVYSVGGSSFSGQSFTAQGSGTFTVPAGVTSISYKAWGAGGGGGGGGTSRGGGQGGGGGYTAGTISVTPGETLNVYVGGAGGGGGRNGGGEGGGGGGHTSLYRGSTPLTIAAGGAGGGGGRNSNNNNNIGGDGGAGGGTTGIGGGASSSAGGGNPGTQSSGGSAGTGGQNSGSAGSSLNGGDGGDARTNQGADGSASNGGLASAGHGGGITNTGRAAGGGGGSGYFGGGGGSASGTGTGGGGGGGGSSFIAGGTSSSSNQAGTGSNPGNAADSSRGSAGNGGSGGATASVGSDGENGSAIVTFGESGGSGVSSTVSWAKFSTSDGTIESADPGNGDCTGWCTTSTYNLPAGRTNFSLVAYNGFLYAIGGQNESGTRQSTVYVAKLGANGEPQLWHPTDTNKNNWTYWHQDGSIPSARSDLSAVAYNNRMYLVGGRTSTGPTNTVHVASINPTGTLGSWTASGTLPYSVYGHSVQVYNDTLYMMGGASSVGGAPLASVYYNRINPDGSLTSWSQTTSMASGRMSAGGNFSVIWGAYVYITGGCQAVNGSGHCTNIRSDTEVSSINADGSIDKWNGVAGVSSQRIGASFIAWRDRLYLVGGCSNQNASTGDCNGSMLGTILYGTINRDGDASTVDQSVPSGTGACSGGAPRGCNLPGTANIGNMLTASAVVNGYLYVIGGCTTNVCNIVSDHVAYAAVSADGSLTRPAACPSGAYQGSMWCVDDVNVTSGGGIAASSPVVFNNRLYLVGGLRGSTGNSNTIQRTTLNDNGSISSWTSQSMTGLGVNSVSYLFAYGRANPSAASTNPGNLYVFGGCSNSDDAGCTAYSPNVYKCNIQTSGAVAGCTTSGQLQIGVIPGDTQSGLGIMSGTVYANYIYLIGGVSPNQVDLGTVRYARFDNSNNVVSAGTSGWTQSDKQLDVGRRRAAAFGYNGYLYVVGGYDGTGGVGVLSDIVFIKINVSDGSLGDSSEGFQESAVTINQRWGLTVPVSNSYAYVIGGCTNGASPGGCTTRTDVVQTFQIYNNNSGAPAKYVATSQAGSCDTQSGNALFQRYNSIGGTAVSDLYGSPSYPNSPSSTQTLSGPTLMTPTNIDENFGGKLSALICAPETGDYVFWISSDDSSELRLSTDSTPANATTIASVNGWAGVNEWNKFPSQQSVAVPLEAGRQYYIEANYKEGAGGDHAQIGWQLPSGSLERPISNTNYSLPSEVDSTPGFQSAPDRIGLSAAVHKGYVYVAGGCTNMSCSSLTNDVQRAAIRVADGSLGSWNDAGSNLPSPRAFGKLLSAGESIYYAGGIGETTACTPDGDARFDRYNYNAGGVVANVYNDPDFPDNPDSTQIRSGGSLESAFNIGDYFNGRLSAIICPPQTGNYRFWITSDDSSELKLSSNASPGDATVIASNPTWANTTDWTKNSAQQSAPIALEAGKPYYIEGIYSENASGDHIRIGWTLPSGTVQRPIPSSNYMNPSNPVNEPKDSVFYTTPNAGGATSSWSTSSNNLPSARSNFGATSWNNRLYIVGGEGSGSGCTTANVCNTVYVSPVLNGGNIPSQWSTTNNAFNVARRGATATSYANNLYVMGGDDGTNYFSDVQYTQINAGDGSTSSWMYTANLPRPVSGADGFATNGYLYLLGGRSSASSCRPSTLIAPISANTTIASGNTPTGVGEWYETNERYGGDRYGATAVQSGGKAHLFGGGCAGFVGAADRTYQTTLLSQPQVAKYSIAIDTDSDVTPTSWLLNGLDNSIGARWQLKYRSMPGTTSSCTSPAMTTWGSETNFGDVTLGQPGVYIPRNASGASTNCARYYYFNVSVDSSRAFGYPDDVSRGPTISDLTLQFTADPSKRLMHGRTFTGGLQQPIDTPYYSQ